jgi:hypothetical protein
MNKTSSLIAVALAACSSAPAGGGGVDSSVGDPVDPGTVSGTPVSGPDFACLSHPPQTIAVDPMTLAGTVQAVTMTGTTPVGAAELQLFHAGTPDVLAHTQSDATGAFSTGAFVSGGHPLQAYLKATKQDYRTTFFYPPFPFTRNATSLPLPMISDALFDTVRTSLHASQDDKHHGVLLVAVADCQGQPVAGATLSVIHGNSQVGTIYNLGTIVPTSAGVYLVFDVPDGKVTVSASFGTTQLPAHDVVVRAKDPDCATARGTLTATTVIPAP